MTGGTGSPGNGAKIGPMAGGKRPSLWRPAFLAVILAVLFFLARFFGLGERLGELRSWMGGMGTWGGLLFILLYALGTVAAFPGSAMAVAAGTLYGSLWGVVLVNIGATIGLGLAFLVSRYMAREAVARWLASSDRFRRLDRLTEEHGAVIVAITRLIPLFPFNMLNYGFGLTSVPFGTYLFWSWLCILPGDILYIVGTDAVVQGIRNGRIPWILVGILAAVAALLAVLVRIARGRLRSGEE